MNRLVIDITELANWSGKLTGVPRVMDELSRRFAKDSGALFVIWDISRQNYFEINYHAIGQTVAHAEAGTNNKETIKKVAHKVNQLKQRSRIFRVAAVMPEKLARRVLLDRPKDIISNQQGFSFTTKDTLFILCDWHGNDRSFVDKIISLKNRGIKINHMSYDLLPIVTPQYSGHLTDSLGYYGKKVYPICDVIFAISEQTKKDVTEWLKASDLNIPKIVVVRLGDDFHKAKSNPPTDIVVKDIVTKKQPYMLCVGTIEARKNHTLLYYVYKLAHNRDIKLPKLVVVGRRGWKSDDIFELITNDPVTKENIIILQNVNDEELSWLYKNCQFTIYPSFYEGWGLPIAESIANGVPCISSNTSSMPEIAGDLIEYFNPTSTDECISKIVYALDLENLKRMKQNLSLYSITTWDSTFDTINSYIRSNNARH